MARMPTSLSASGTATDASTPVSPNSNGPSTSRARQPRSQVVPAGTRSSGQTTDISPAVRVTQKNGAPVAHAGISESGSSRQTARRCSSTERRSETPGVHSAGSPTRALLDVARGPGASAADVGDESGDLLGGCVVRGDGEHRVLAGYGAHDLQTLHPVKDAGDGPCGPVARIYNHHVLGRGEVEDEAREDLDAGGAGLVREREVAAADLENAELGEVPAHGGLRGLHALLGESFDHALLGAELPLGDEPEYEVLPGRLVRRRARRSQSPSLLLEVLEPEVLGVPQRQVHVLYRSPGRALEQVVHRREEQEFPSPPVNRRREPGPVGVSHVRDVRRLLSRLHELPATVVLRVPTQHFTGSRKTSRFLELHDDGLQFPAADGQEVWHEGYIGRLPHPAQHHLYLGRVPVAWRAVRDPIRRDALVDRNEVGLDAWLRPGAAHPRERVDRYGTNPLPQPPHHGSEREYRRRRVTPGVRNEPPLRRPKDLGQPVVRFLEQPRRAMLPVPLLVDLHVREPEICREVHDQPRPRAQQPLHRRSALAVPIGHERRVQRRGVYLPWLDVLTLNRQLWVHLGDPTPRVPARGNPHSPNLGVPRKQTYQLGPRVPAAAVDARLESHIVHCRTFG